MTNEKIEMNARFFADNQGHKLGLSVEKRKALSDALTILVQRHVEKAYEEAARIAEEAYEQLSSHDETAYAMSTGIAKDIRALKDSLVAETVSSS